VVVNFIRKGCWLLGSQLSIGQYDAIAIAIVNSCTGCSCCGVPVALGGKDVLAMLFIADVSTLLLMIKDNQ